VQCTNSGPGVRHSLMNTRLKLGDQRGPDPIIFLRL